MFKEARVGIAAALVGIGLVGCKPQDPDSSDKSVDGAAALPVSIDLSNARSETTSSLRASANNRESLVKASSQLDALALLRNETDLKHGARGSLVTTLQEAIQYARDPFIAVDAIYGDETARSFANGVATAEQVRPIVRGYIASRLLAPFVEGLSDTNSFLAQPPSNEAVASEILRAVKPPWSDQLDPQNKDAVRWLKVALEVLGYGQQTRNASFDQSLTEAVQKYNTENEIPGRRDIVGPRMIESITFKLRELAR